MPRVPSKGVSAFEDKQSLLISHVGAHFSFQSNINMLIGVNHMGILSDNPRYHVQFMISVFKMNHAELLVKVIAWEYRVCKYRGIHYDYFPLALKIWRDAVQTHLNPEDASPIVGVYDWLLDHNGEFVKIADSSVPLLIPTLVGWEEPQKSLLQLLLKGDTTGSLRLANSLVSSPNEYQQFCRQVVQPVMYEIGRLWEHGTITAAHEHLATAIISRVTISLYAPYVSCEPRKGKAVIASVLNEFHELGARMVADFLEIDGWDVYYLGASIPQDEVIKMIEEIKPDIVGLSVVMPFNLENAREMIEKICSHRIRPKVIVGGPVAAYIPDAFSRMGADAYAKSATDVLFWAQEVWKAKGIKKNGNRKS